MHKQWSHSTDLLVTIYVTIDEQEESIDSFTGRGQ